MRPLLAVLLWSGCSAAPTGPDGVAVIPLVGAAGDALTAQEAAGRAIYIREGCFNCHDVSHARADSDPGGAGAIARKGPVSAPNLANAGRKYTAQWHHQHLRDPRSLRERSIMPAYGEILTESERSALVAYLLQLGPHSQ